MDRRRQSSLYAKIAVRTIFITAVGAGLHGLSQDDPARSNGELGGAAVLLLTGLGMQRLFRTLDR